MRYGLSAIGLAGLLGACAHHGRAVNVQPIVAPDGSTQHMIECPDAQLECIIMAGHLCPRGYDPQPGSGWMIVKCRDANAGAARVETANMQQALPPTMPLMRRDRRARYASRGSIRIGGQIELDADIAKVKGATGRDDAISVGFVPAVGVFPLDGLEASLSPMVHFSSTKNTGGVATRNIVTGALLGARYLFATGPVFPYVGAGAGWILLSSTTVGVVDGRDVGASATGDGFFYGGGLGVDVPLGGPAVGGIGLTLGHADVEVRSAGALAEMDLTMFAVATSFSVFF